MTKLPHTTTRTTHQGFPMPTSPVGEAAAWRGADLAGRQEWIYHLDAQTPAYRWSKYAVSCLKDRLEEPMLTRIGG